MKELSHNDLALSLCSPDIGLLAAYTPEPCASVPSSKYINNQRVKRMFAKDKVKVNQYVSTL